jgi:uncharacterized protein DUF998
MITRKSLGLACGAIGGPLFVLVFLVEGARRDGYDPMREPVSSLALGQRGWIQRANFVGTGLLMLAFADGLRQTSAATPGGSRLGPRLVATYAIGLIGAGIFVTEAPADAVAERPGARPAGLEGTLHVAFSVQVFAALSAAALVYARWFAMHGRQSLARGSALVGALVPAGIMVFGRAQGREDPLGRAAGLIQRLTIALGWGWLFVLASDGLFNPLGCGGLRP